MSGIEWGYARVSSKSQDLQRQIHTLTQHGIPEGGEGADRHLYVDKATGRNMQREGWQQLRPRMRAGDVLTLESLDRLGRSQTEMLTLFNELISEGIDVNVIAGPIPFDTRKGGAATEMAKAILIFLGEVELIYKRERVASAKAAGKTIHRPRKMTPELEQRLAEEYGNGGKTVDKLADEFKVSRATVYRIVRERSVQARPHVAPPTRGRSLTDAQVEMARELKEAGKSVRKIAAAIGSSPATVQRALTKA